MPNQHMATSSIIFRIQSVLISEMGDIQNHAEMTDPTAIRNG